MNFETDNKSTAEPGGYLQWDEFDAAEFKTLPKEPRMPTSALHELEEVFTSTVVMTWVHMFDQILAVSRCQNVIDNSPIFLPLDMPEYSKCTLEVIHSIDETDFDHRSYEKRS